MNLLLVCNPLIKIGGAQDYTIKKALDLKKSDFGVTILSSEISKEYRDILNANNIPFLVKDEMKINPLFYSSTEREQILNNLIDLNLVKQITLIESHQIFPMLWGELLAAKLRVTNLVYILSSESSYKRYLKNFIIGKATQKQILGCNSIYLKTIFNEINYNTKYNSYINISIDRTNIDKNVLIPKELLNQLETVHEKSGIRVLTISRLEKNYVLFLLNDLIATAKKYPDKYFHLTIVGDGENRGLLERISKNNNPPNFTVFFTGFLKPLPQNIFANHDLYIGGGTTIILASSNNLPSLVVSHKAEAAIGYFGEEASDFGGGQYEGVRSYTSFLEDIINRKSILQKSKKAAFNLYNSEFSEEEIYKRFITLYKESNNRQQSIYFVNIKLRGLESLRKIIYKCIGRKFFIKFNNSSIKMKNRFNYYHWKWQAFYGDK